MLRSIIKFLLHLFIYVHVSTTVYCIYMLANTTVYAWMSEDNLQKLFLSFHYVGSGDWAQVIKVGSKCLYPISLAPDPFIFIFE